jgi:triacylglycerol lipase
MNASRDAQERSPSFIFVHGILGFSHINLGLWSIDYFRKLRAALSARHYPASFPALPPTGSVMQRATALAKSLAEIHCEKLILVAHSMGGLDSRYLIHNLDPTHRVQCLITIGTPHRGSPLAAWLLKNKGLVPWLGSIVGGIGLHDLTPEACARFNEKNPNRPDVRYLSYAGARPQEEMPKLLRSWTQMIEKNAGDNDSQVPVASAKWGEFQGTVRASHTELVGWPFALPNSMIQRPFNHLDFYLDMVANVSDSYND